MKRRLFTLLSALSLLLCVAVCVLWVRSLTAQDGFCWRTYPPPEGGRLQSRSTTVYTQLGGVWIKRTVESCDPANAILPIQSDWSGDPGLYVGSGDIDHHVFGYDTDFSFTNSVTTHRMLLVHGDTATEVSSLRIPLLTVLLITAVAPAVAAFGSIRRHLRRTRRPGLGPACGYDLRATPGRCPECGASSGSHAPLQRRRRLFKSL